MRNVLRTTPMNLRPYRVFSCMTSNLLHNFSSGSDSRSNGKPCFALNFSCEAMLSRDTDGRYSLSAASGWGLDWPVVLIDWGGAKAYAAWLTQRTRQRWRLPMSLEWEKAARGVDGRIFPWGSFLDPSWCCIRQSHRGAPSIVPIHRYPSDVSRIRANDVHSIFFK